MSEQINETQPRTRLRSVAQLFGRLALTVGGADLLYKMLEDASTSAGLFPFTLIVAGCITELAVNNSQTDNVDENTSCVSGTDLVE